MTTTMPFSYAIRRSARATKVRIIVSVNKVEVVAPVKVAEKHIHQFVIAQQAWIIASLTKIAERHQPHPEPVVYGEGSMIVYQGESYPLTLKPSSLKRVKIEFTNGFIAHIPDTLTTQHSEAIKPALLNWMKKRLLHEATHWVKQHAAKHQLIPRTINIRKQKSRWGSCGIHNDIQINALLIMAPPAVLEYVVVHELCHIKIRNHSPHFWALVAEHLPDYKIPHRWLKQHGSRLMQG
ncbi:MAG: SprT family zinc-dependent metalloprotease [Methylococcales bacterium]|nr:SprT family zinc-dependent metalloprotease [Methylococcales bacterium]